MQLKAIKVGRWYETRLGVGECLSAGGTFPPSVSIRITLPFPRGVVLLGPRDVVREVEAPVAVAPAATAAAKETP